MASPTPTNLKQLQPTNWSCRKISLSTCPDFEVLTSRPGKLHEGFGNVEPIQLGGLTTQVETNLHHFQVRKVNKKKKHLQKPSDYAPQKWEWNTSNCNFLEIVGEWNQQRWWCLMIKLMINHHTGRKKGSPKSTTCHKGREVLRSHSHYTWWKP